MKMRNSLRLTIFVFLFGLGFFSNAQEEKFKALFIYKFAEYVEWPSASNPITVGIAGNTNVFKELAKFAESKGNMSVIQISSPGDVNKCQIVFIPDAASGQIGSYAGAVGSKSILIVSDKKELAGKGSDIGFYMEGSKLRFLISEQTIRDKKMVPSGKLLALGTSI